MGPNDPIFLLRSPPLYTIFPSSGVKKDMASTFLEFIDLSPAPRVVADLPSLRIGDPLTLRFHLERMHLGRREVLEVDGEYRVTKLQNSIHSRGFRQIAQIAATGKAPFWRAVKLQTPRSVCPARFPPTKIK